MNHNGKLCTVCIIFCLLTFTPVLTDYQLLQAQQPDSCNCTTIDFESIPGDSIYEGLTINQQYEAELGMTFILEDSTFPHIADVGGAKTAFESAYGDDTPAPNQNTGSFFLTDDGLTSGLTSSPLIIIFSIPVDSASGYMLDIDASEQFTVHALGDTGQILYESTIKAGDPGTGDGLATKWSVKRDTTDIYRIRLAGKRTTAGFFGLGFDNFTSCSSLRINSIESDGRIDPIANDYVLFQNYPNPFNPVTNIDFNLKKSGFVELKIFNSGGELISVVISRYLDSGNHHFSFNGENLASGVYFYQLTADDYRDVKKMILLK